MFILRVLCLCVLTVKIGGLVRIQANGVGELFVANTFRLNAFFSLFRTTGLRDQDSHFILTFAVRS